MSKPTVRVLALLELLQSNGQLSGSELARRLRWMDGRCVAISSPSRSWAYHLGGARTPWRLPPGGRFQAPAADVQRGETLAVSLGLLAVRSLGLGESELALESAQAKLGRVMPVALRRRRGSREPPAWTWPAPGREPVWRRWRPSPKPPRSVRGSSSAIATRGAETLRQLDPYGLVIAAAAGTSAVSATCAQALRTFRLDRLDAPRMLAGRFERPADFDTLRHLRESFARMPRAHPVEILMRAAREQVVAVLGEAPRSAR
ncbi:helix-turn-helix transcriptional regulator [Pseudomonas aeruginosa]